MRYFLPGLFTFSYIGPPFLDVKSKQRLVVYTIAIEHIGILHFASAN
jgi:hypothetical protein